MEYKLEEILDSKTHVNWMKFISHLSIKYSQEYGRKKLLKIHLVGIFKKHLLRQRRLGILHVKVKIQAECSGSHL